MPYYYLDPLKERGNEVLLRDVTGLWWYLVLNLKASAGFCKDLVI